MKYELVGMALAVLMAVLATVLSLLGQEGTLLWSARADELAQAILAAFGITYIVMVIIAVFQISGQEQSDRLKNSLCAPSYRPVYDSWAERSLTKAREWAGVPPPEPSAGVWQLLKEAFTYRLLDRALLLAVIYPLLSLLLFWALTGRPGTLGQITVISPATPAWKGPAVLLCIAFAAGGKQYVKWVQTHWRLPWSKVADGLDVVAFVIAFAFAAVFLSLLNLPPVAFVGAFVVAVVVVGVVVGVFAGVVAFAVAIAGAIAVAFAAAGVGVGAFAVAGAFASAGAGAFAFAFAFEKLDERRQGNAAGCLAIFAPIIAVVAGLQFLPWSAIAERSDFALTVFLFLGIAPLVNALFDFVSYAVTLALAERGRRGSTIAAVLCGLLDALVAILLFLCLGTVLVAVASIMNKITGVSFVDLGSLLAEAGDFRQYWWLYLMLFSTAIPTGLHLVLVSISLQACVPNNLRSPLCEQIDRARAGGQRASAVAAFLLGLIWTIGIIIVFGALFLLGYLFWNHGIGVFLNGYKDWLLHVATWAGGI